MVRQVSLDIDSRLSATPLIQLADTNLYFYGVWGRIEFPARNDDRMHTLRKRDILNWPGLSNDFYQNPNRAWILWSANNIVDPWASVPGTRIRVPSPSHVDEVLTSITKDAE